MISIQNNMHKVLSSLKYARNYLKSQHHEYYYIQFKQYLDSVSDWRKLLDFAKNHINLDDILTKDFIVTK